MRNTLVLQRGVFLKGGNKFGPPKKGEVHPLSGLKNLRGQKEEKISGVNFNTTGALRATLCGPTGSGELANQKYFFKQWGAQTEATN